jgi:adenosylmethionine-8-amino-7-oxononanoate aminotransferase
VLTLAQPFLTALVKQSGSPFYNHLAQSLVQLFSRVGVARVILSDQGSNFTSTLLKQLYEMLGVNLITDLRQRHKQKLYDVIGEISCFTGVNNRCYY